MTLEHKTGSMLVIGGCRSGKSSYALEYCNHIAKGTKYFLATSVPLDDEMNQRVTSHQKERGSDWQTIEEPVNINQVLLGLPERTGVVLVDCITLWISNLMAQRMGADDMFQEAHDLGSTLQDLPFPVVLVTNEVGSGIVPENALARAFRDNAGKVNQIIANAVDRVVYTVAGIPMQIKPGSVPLA